MNQKFLAGTDIGAPGQIDSGWGLFDNNPPTFPQLNYGSLLFDVAPFTTPDYRQIPSSSPCWVQDLPFTAIGTILGQDVIGSGLPSRATARTEKAPAWWLPSASALPR